MSATQTAVTTKPMYPGSSTQHAIDALIASNNKVKRSTVTVDLPSMATHVEGTGTVAVAGSKTTDFVAVQAPAGLDAGVLIKRAWISVDGTLSVTAYNTTAGTIDPASASFELLTIATDTITAPVAHVGAGN